GESRPGGEGDRTRGPATANGSHAADLLLPGRLTYPEELAAATLLASGILAALGRRRREQLWQRAFGRRVVAPEGQAALAESALRAGAHEPSARLLDHGLRYLSHAVSLSGRIPPAVVAAHLSHDNLDLWMTPADPDAPAPWTAVGDGEVWRLPSTALGRVDIGEVGDALYPGLVSLGTDGAGRVLVDVEAAHGVISVTGPQTMTIAVLSAMALELATSGWSDRMHITLAGFGEDLTALAPDRITAVPTLEEALPALEAHAIDVAEAMAASGVSSVLEGRALGVNPQAWVPHYLISAVPPSPRERSRLLTLARVGRAAAAGYVVAGDVPGSSWAWEVTPEGRLLAGGLGFEVQAQLTPARQHEALVGLFTAAAQPEGAPLTPPPAHAAPPEHLDSGRVLPVDIAILGPASVRAPGPIEPDRAALATELVVYLAVHPGGVHPNVLGAALWPRGVAAEVRDAAVARATGWLGTDSIGRPHLAADASGRLRLGSGVRVDWQVFRALAGHAELAPPGGAEEAHHLARALDLVQGQLLEGRPPGRYAWLATDELEYEVTARVADAAHRLAGLRLAGGDPEGAIGAARAGLRLARHDELLWRDLLRAAHQTGRPDLLRAVVEELCARTALDEVLPRMAPQTESLIDELYPAWRSAVP
ncbi:MAG TPA: bacterial transcriptional activator domain-containing protein, partial [Streptosporangiaceae bacterium]